MLLSVIIPVYNVEGTLRRCLESVKAQGVDGMEIIIVDDGSTDGSSEICDEYDSQNVKVIHQVNAGLSEARNAGLELAEGEYVTFVDSDDYLDPMTFVPLLGMIQSSGVDIMEYSFARDDKRGHSWRHIFMDHTYTDSVAYWLEEKAYAHAYAWNKIFRRQLFSDVRFPKGKKFEDVPTIWHLIANARAIATTPAGMYHYTCNLHGITQRAGGNEYRDLLEAHIGIVSNEWMRSRSGFKDYYRHVLNIQLQTFIYTGYGPDIKLPTIHYCGSVKLLLLNVLGMKGLCELTRTVKTLF